MESISVWMTQFLLSLKGIMPIFVPVASDLQIGFDYLLGMQIKALYYSLEMPWNCILAKAPFYFVITVKHLELLNSNEG